MRQAWTLLGFSPSSTPARDSPGSSCAARESSVEVTETESNASTWTKMGDSECEGLAREILCIVCRSVYIIVASHKLSNNIMIISFIV